MLVGEQPGNEEDLAGHPFVGPAGRLLDRALAEAGIARDQAYVTNVVKHFKWEPRAAAGSGVAAHPRQTQLRRNRRLPPLASGRNGSGPAARPGLPRRHRSPSPARPPVPRHAKPRPVGRIFPGAVRFGYGPPVLHSPRADSATRHAEMARFIDDLRLVTAVLEAGDTESTVSNFVDLMKPEAAARLRHSLLTPLYQVIGYAEMVREEAVEQNATAEAALMEEAAAGARRMVAMLRWALPLKSHVAEGAIPRLCAWPCIRKPRSFCLRPPASKSSPPELAPAKSTKSARAPAKSASLPAVTPPPRPPPAPRGAGGGRRRHHPPHRARHAGT